MAAFRSEETALGSARGRFLESLPRKAIELRGGLAQLTADPAASAPRDDARRRLHALYASALVFRSEALASVVQEGIARLDAAAEAARALRADELEALSRLVKRIAEFRIDDAAPEAPTISDVAPAPTGRRRSNTLTGLLPVGAPVATPSEMPGRWVARGSGRPAEARRPTLQRVLHVLLVAPEAELPELLQLLSGDESLRVSAVGSAREALESAAEGAPDVILAAAAPLADGMLIEGLRKSPLTDFVPLVAIAGGAGQPGFEGARPPGVDELVTHPLRIDLLLRVLGRATGTLVEAEALPALHEANIEEVAARVGEEIRRGLVDAAESGRELKVPLGEGSEVLAAAWAAVARVRALFSERSGGRVRFSDRNLRAAPALLTLSAGAAPPLPGEQNPVAGRRIVVADDDLAVVQGFARLLREEGAYVIEAGDGAEALRAARRERPDLVIVDVIMPGLDGFALCRELKRDPLLADVPVILISWKEDLLARMRELSSGASGYLRKEASAAQIVAGVREVLAPRSRLEADLAGASEVRGNLEGTGVVALMRSVRRARPDARVTLRDAWNLFECELRDGRLAQLTRTASDGSFVRNEKALPQLLGVGAGRFAVTAAEGPLKHALEGSLDEVLARGARELAAQLDALTGEQLERVERLVFDEDAQAALLDHVPPLVREVMRCLSEGERPSNLWRRGVLERGMLEQMLLDMAKRGVIRALLGAQREDLVAVARAQRSRLPPTELGSPRSMLPPAPVPVISVLQGDRSELPPARDASGEQGAPNQVVLTPLSVPAPAARAHDALEQTREAHTAGGDPREQEGAPASEPGASVPAQDRAPAGALRAEQGEPSGELPPPQPAPEGEPSGAAPRAADLEPRALAQEPAAGATDAPREPGLESPEAGAEAGESPRDSGVEPRGSVRDRDPAALDPEAAEGPAQPSSAPAARAAEAAPARAASDPRELDPGAAEARTSRGTLWAWTAAFVALVAVGFLLDRARTPELVAPRVEAIGAAPERAHPAPPQATATQVEAPAAPEQPSSEAPPPALVSAAEGGFEISDRILDVGVQVAPEQALLVVEAKPGAGESQLTLDGKALGALPVKLGVSEGIHELAITRGDSVVYRFLTPRRGSTWLLREP